MKQRGSYFHIETLFMWITGETPAFLVFGRKPHAHLDFLQPNPNEKCSVETNSEGTCTAGQKGMDRDFSTEIKVHGLQESSQVYMC